MMKCLSLWQPYATAVAMRWKQYETRSWARGYRGPLAIHAAKQDGVATTDITRMAYKLLSQGKAVDAMVADLPQFPRGAIVAYAEVVSIQPSEFVSKDLALKPDSMELLWGDFGPNRYAWRLDNVRQLEVPIPFRAKQGLFNLDAATERKVRRAAGVSQALEL